MKGLLLFELLNLKRTYLIASLFLVFISLIGLWENDHLTSTTFIVTTFPFIYLASEEKHKNGWRKLEKVFPINISRLILSKYLSFLINVFLGVLLVGIYILINYIFRQNVLDTAINNLIIISIGLSISYGSVYYPFLFLIEANKSKLVVLVALILPIIKLCIFYIWATRSGVSSTFFAVLLQSNIWLTYLMISIITLFISYFVAKYCYQFIEL